MRKLLFYARLAAQNLRKNSIFYGPNLLACSLCTALLYIVRFLTYSDMVRTMRGGASVGVMLSLGTLVLTVMVLPSIINVAAGRRTPDVVQQIRQRHPSIPLLASGGSTDESMAETIVAGANALTWTPPNAQEMQRSMMMRYRGESTGDNMQH